MEDIPQQDDGKRSSWMPATRFFASVLAHPAKAVTRAGDPVELSAAQARQLARALEELAEEDDA